MKINFTPDFVVAELAEGEQRAASSAFSCVMCEKTFHYRTASVARKNSSALLAMREKAFQPRGARGCVIKTIYLFDE
jgi:hypothetical protein